MSDISTPVVIDYTNWQGIRSKRRILPQRLVWGSNQWHKEHQWFIDALDADHPEKGMRYFALSGVHGWDTPNPVLLTLCGRRGGNCQCTSIEECLHEKAASTRAAPLKGLNKSSS